MRQQDFFIIDPVRCHYCQRCQQHNREQHENHLSRWCDSHHRWCGNHEEIDEETGYYQETAKVA